MVGFDTGMPIAYALTADHPELLDRLVVGESIVPGVTPSPPLLVPGPLNARRWHIAFNRLAGEVNERLVRGREDIYCAAEYANSAGTPLPDEVVRYYIDRLAFDSEALRGSFEFYRAIDITIAQNAQRKTKRLTLPVLAIGGAKGIGEGTANTMKLVADDVQRVIIPGSGHWVAEEAPEPLLSAITAFLTPYRTEGVAASQQESEVITETKCSRYHRLMDPPFRFWFHKCRRVEEQSLRIFQGGTA
jgi:pimeloyl-ACP methyl ester carboxylesterase